MEILSNNHKKLQKAIGIIISIIMSVQLVMPTSLVRADDSNFITNVTITDLDGAPLGEKVDVKQSIKIFFEYKFDSSIYKPGVKYNIKFPIEIKSEETQYEIMVRDIKIGKEIKLGTFFLDNNGNGSIEFEDFGDKSLKASGNFVITTGFNGDAIGDGGKKKVTFTVGAKNTDIMIDFDTNSSKDDPDKATITKEATSYDRMANEVTWTIKVDAKETPKSGLYIVDTLGNTKINKDNSKYPRQEFYEDSLYVNGVKADPSTYSFEGGKLKYNLPDNITGVTTITVKSKLLKLFFEQDDASKINDKDKFRTANNGVELFQNNKKISEATANKDIPILWVDKIGLYNIHNRTIDWTITLNNYGETIRNFSLSDIIVSSGKSTIKKKVIKDGKEVDELVYLSSGETTFVDGSLKIVGENDEELPEEIKKGLIFDVQTKTITFKGNYDRVIKIKYSCSIPEDVYTKEAAMNYKNIAEYSAENLNKDSVVVNVPIDGRLIYKDNGKYKDQKTGEIPQTYNPATHELIWRIIVNLNLLELDNTKITDIIPDDQEYVEGSLESTIVLGGNILPYKGKCDVDYNNDTRILTCDLGDLKEKVYLTYRTKIKDKNIYGNNFDLLSAKDRTFSNTATISTDFISIKPSYTATQTLKDVSILKKTGIDYDYNTNYVTWKVEINATGYRKEGTETIVYPDITHAKLTDDIPSNQEYVDGSFTIDNEADISGFKYIKSTSGDTSKSGTLIYDFGSNTINKKYTITYKTKIIDEDFFNPAENGGKEKNIVENSAKLEGDELADGGIVAKGSEEIECSAIQKDFNYEKSKNKITWKILVNNNKLDLLDGEIQDIIPEGLDVNMSSLKLYRVDIKKDPTTGKFGADEDTKVEVPLLDKYITFNEKTRALKVGIKDMKNYTYLLEFVTMLNTSVLDKNIKSITNNASFNGTVLSGGNSATVDDVKYVKVEGEGKIETNDIIIKKIDADTGEPIEGAKFMLFDSEDNVVSKESATNEKGEVTFKSVILNKNYKVKEVEAAPGYFLDPNDTNSKFVMLTTEDLDTGKIVEWTNSKAKGSITLTKVNAENIIEKLSGAEFAVYKDVNNNGKYDKGIDTFVDNLIESDKNKGVYSLENIVAGSYLVKEIKAPDKFVLDDNYYPANIKENGQKVNIETSSGKFFGNMPIRGILSISKVDFKDNTKKLPGAEFEIYKDVDKDGKFNVDVDKFVKKLSGTTGEYGDSSILYGSYLIKESKAPLGYNIDSTYYPFSISVNNQKFVLENEENTGVFTNRKILGSIEINKVDKDDTTKKLQNSEFELYKDVDKNGKYDVGIDEYYSTISNVTGEYFKSNLEYGSYLIRESKAPEGYVRDKNYYDFEINEEGQNVVISNNNDGNFVNEKIKGSVKISKIDADDSSLILSGATFEVYKDVDKDGKFNADKDILVGSLKDNDGIYTLDNLEYGSYLVKETAAPLGYDKDENYYPFEVVNDGEEKIIENEKDKGFVNKKVDTSVGVTKVDKDDNSIKLPGATFTLYEDVDKDGKLDLNKDKFISNLEESNGLYYKNHLLNGSYLIQETTSPKGYVIDSKVYPFEISDDNKKVVIYNNEDTKLFENEIIKGKVEINKVDSEDTNIKLTGAKFKIYKDVNNNGVYDEGIDEYYRNFNELSGYYYVDDIPYGSYLVKETTAPNGYELDSNYYVFSILENDVVVKVENEPGKGFTNNKIQNTVNTKDDLNNVESTNKLVNKADEKVIGTSSSTGDEFNKILYTIIIITSLFVVGIGILQYTRRKKENNN